MRQGRELPVGVGVPEAYVPAQRTSGNQTAVRAVGNPIALGIPGQDLDRGLGRHVPEADRPVKSHAGELAPVGTEVPRRRQDPGAPAARRPACPWPTSHSRTEPSRLPEASSVPAGLKTARASPCPIAGAACEDGGGLPVVRSQRVIVSPRVTVASWLPLGVPDHGADDLRVD